MKFYPHHISDFNNATRHLTRVERSVYRDAIELYYDTESVLTNDIDRLARKLLCTSDEEISALKYVLGEFFEPTDDGFFHDRCDSEIAKYRANTSAKAKAGIASAKARKQKAAKRKQTSTRVKSRSTPVHNQEPITNNQEPIEKQYAFAGECIKITRDDFDDLTKTYPNLDLITHLKQLDLELRDTKKWWPVMHAKLNYRNQNHAKSTRTSEPRSVADRIRAGNAKRSAEREAALQSEWQVVDENGAALGADGRPIRP